MINMRLALLISLSVFLFISCVSTPDEGHETPDTGYRFLKKGKKYLNNDEYINAINRFNQALIYYEGLDDRTGIADCRFGLTEASIALGNLDVAQKHLTILYSMEDETEIDRFSEKVVMLDVRILYLSKMYDEALIKIEPLLPEFDDMGRLQNKADIHILNIIAGRTLLAFETDLEHASQWTQCYESALRSYGGNSPSHNALLERFNANNLIQNKEYTQAEGLLENALSIYKGNSDRRSIAATLREVGLLKIKQQQWEEADYLLQRALKIRTLILDHLGTTVLLNDLITMNRVLGNDTLVERYQNMLTEIDTRK